MDRYENALEPLSDAEANALNPVALAYLGDTVYDLYIRAFLVKNKMGTVNALHCFASSTVNAKAQAEAAAVLLAYFTDEEKSIYKRGRNAKSGGVPKNMEVADYRKATGLEAVLGYLYATGQTARLQALMKIVVEKSFAEG